MAAKLTCGFIVLAVTLPMHGFSAESSAAPTPEPEQSEQVEGDRKDSKFGSRFGGDRDRKLPTFSTRPLPGEFKEKLKHLSPSEREKFMENWQKWRSMDGRLRREMQSRAMADFKRIKDTIDDAIESLDIELDRDGRELFMLRYRQERRKIEETLQSEIRGRRETLNSEMLERLKGEFKTADGAVKSSSESGVSESSEP